MLYCRQLYYQTEIVTENTQMRTRVSVLIYCTADINISDNDSDIYMTYLIHNCVNGSSVVLHILICGRVIVIDQYTTVDRRSYYHMLYWRHQYTKQWQICTRLSIIIYYCIVLTMDIDNDRPILNCENDWPIQNWVADINPYAFHLLEEIQ